MCWLKEGAAAHRIVRGLLILELLLLSLHLRATL